MRCPACGSFDDKVVDSRQADDGTSIRRRRACIDCGRRFTTFERLEEVSLVVIKRSGEREPFERDKVAAGIRLAAKGRPIEADGGAGLDEVTYLRFASVYQGFDDVDDFRRELGLLRKETEPKRHGEPAAPG